jgi:hypothetical protein
MRKELIFAIAAGILFGAVVAFGIFRANKAIKSNPQEISTSKQEKEKKDAEEEKVSDITLTKPENYDVLGESPTVISGITAPDVRVLISSNENDHIITSDSSGSFHQEIDLSPSINLIAITLFDDNSILEKDIITVIHSTEFFSNLEIDEENETESSEEADVISKKVENKLYLAKNKPKASIGTVTDITEDTLQIKNEVDEIQQVSITDSTTYLMVKKETEQVNFEDMAIGDYVVTMGFKNDAGVLETKRVLISDPFINNNNIFYGKLSAIDKKIVTFQGPNTDEYIVSFGKRWNGPEIDELEEGENYIVVATQDDDDLIIRTIEPAKLIPTNPSPTPEESN